MKTVTLSIPDMKCDGCVSAVKEALETQHGVGAVEVSLQEKTARIVASDDVAADILVSAVEAAGYKASHTS
jgi:copper chaperone CopZ